MADNDQKLAYFEEITGVTDSSLSLQILEAYGWDLDSAVQAMVEQTPHHTNPVPEYDESMRVSGSGSVQEANPADTGPGMLSVAAGTSSPPPTDPLAAAMGLWAPSISETFMDDRSLFERIRDGELHDAITGGVLGPEGTTTVWRVVTLSFLIFAVIRCSGFVGLGLLLAGGVLSAGLGFKGLHNSCWSFFFN